MRFHRIENSHFRRGLIYGFPVIIYAGLIFLLSSLPQPPDDRFPFRDYDKLTHFLEYFFFGILLCRWFLNTQYGFFRRHALFMTMLIGTCYGVSDEWHQSFIPGRDATLWDVIFDAAGIGAAIFTYPITLKRCPFLGKLDEMLERKFIHEA